MLFIIAERGVLSYTTPAAIRPAKALKDNGVEVFLLIVGKHVTNNLPNKVASEPFQSHVFQVRDFQDLSRLAKAFRDKGKYFSNTRKELFRWSHLPFFQKNIFVKRLQVTSYEYMNQEKLRFVFKSRGLSNA